MAEVSWRKLVVALTGILTVVFSNVDSEKSLPYITVIAVAFIAADLLQKIIGKKSAG